MVVHYFEFNLFGFSQLLLVDLVGLNARKSVEIAHNPSVTRLKGQKYLEIRKQKKQVTIFLQNID